MPSQPSEFGHLKNYIFGSTSAVITNVSLIVGLGSSHTGKLAILGALLTIALADNISDSLGVHMYREAEGQTMKTSALSMVLNFTARLIISASFIIIMLAFSIPQAGVIAMFWGLCLLSLISYLICRQNHTNPWKEIFKHLLVAAGVVIASHYVGDWIGRHF